jgi:DNA topoisomerase IA
MRTDALNLSDDALEAAKKEIIQTYGAEYSNTTKYKSKSK